jgi:chemotaxis protein MotA
MDIASIIGLIAAMSLFFWSLYSGSSGDLGAFWDTPSAILVFGGTFGIVLMCVRLERFLAVFKVMMQVFLVRKKDPAEVIKQLVKLSETARREGLLALQTAVESLPDPFLQNGIQMVVDGNTAETISEVLDADIDWLSQRHDEGKGVFDLCGKYGPAMGMIGTLVGLVAMLKNMDDPSKLGPSMAIALLTTLYGAIIANVIALPFVDKLTDRHDNEMLVRSIMKAGILGLQAGDNPRVLEMKLAVFLSPGHRAAALAKEGA